MLSKDPYSLSNGCCTSIATQNWSQDLLTVCRCSSGEGKQLHMQSHQQLLKK